jgi:hypothetical protein
MCIPLSFSFSFSLKLASVVLASLIILGSAKPALAWDCDIPSDSGCEWENTSEWCPCIGVSCGVGPQQNRKCAGTRDCLRGIQYCPFPCSGYHPAFTTGYTHWICDPGLCGVGATCTINSGTLISDCRRC